MRPKEESYALSWKKRCCGKEVEDTGENAEEEQDNGIRDREVTGTRSTWTRDAYTCGAGETNRAATMLKETGDRSCDDLRGRKDASAGTSVRDRAKGSERGARDRTSDSALASKIRWWGAGSGCRGEDPLGGE